MLIEVKVPELAESVAEATLVKWLKQPGETIEEGENLVEIETDKVMLEVAAPESGLLKEVTKKDSELVLSNEVIAVIDTEGTATAAVSPQQVKEAVASVAATTAEHATEPAVPAPPPAPTEPQAPKLSPAVRKMLEENRLEPTQIKPTASPERITKEDVLNYLKSNRETQQPAKKPAPLKQTASQTPAPHPPAVARTEQRIPMTPLRKRIAERLLSAQHENAILTTFNEVNMQPVMMLRKRYRDKFEETYGVRLGFMSFFVMAAVLALKRFPLVNASIDGTDIIQYGHYDIGIAVSSPRGLVVPVLRDTDQLSMAAIEEEITDYGRKAKSNKLGIEDLTGGTFTITNGGVFGSLLSTPILNPPQSAILGMHKIQDRPMAENGQVVIRPMMYLALSYDHRIIDGKEAVQFLVTIKEQIEDPSRLLLQI
ncbi:MAG: 2-oxoglutarate dehydrogenase complex dihydrolipoyllysine-residue succinyltransferase [Gammaproteobacteria bacterium]|nr:2-oxoglutarate dehydrogenase complex dihydrolipoyllysine-residue succinyltransferase [Gammaproteobacteria bacterium]